MYRQKDFAVEVNKGFTGKPPYLLTIRRIRPDDSKAFLENGTVVKFSKEEIGLSDVIEMILINEIGDTSPHR